MKTIKIKNLKINVIDNKIIDIYLIINGKKSIDVKKCLIKIY